MKAAQFHARADVRVDDVAEPEPTESEALVAIEWCGICGTDVHEYEHGPFGVPRPERPHPATGEIMPVTLGHEFTGRIIRAPSGSSLSPGEAVVVDPRIYCNKCPQCNAGCSNGCSTLGFKGLSGTGGGFSEAVAVDAKLCHPIPNHVDLALAALIEPLAVAWHAICLCGVSDWSSKTSLILGGGPIGIACAIGLRARGCKQIVMSEPSKARAAQNRQVADVVLNPTNEDIGSKCRELTSGEGIDIAFDCAGVQQAFEAGMNALRFRGTYINLAVWTTPMAIPFMHFMKKEITTKCAIAYSEIDFKETVDAFLAGKFEGIGTMITSRIHIDDIVTEGFEELLKRKDNHIKIMVTPDKTKA